MASVGARPAGYVRTSYAPGEVDLFGIYCGELDRCFLMSAGEVSAKHQIQLRLEPARNSQRACVNLAEEYAFDGAVAQLARAFGWQPKGQGFESPQLHFPPEDETRLGANEFRNRFGYWMERAAAGQPVLVTRRGRPFVRVGPP